MRKLLLAVLFLAAACRSGNPPLLLPHPAPENKGVEREKWLYELRAYPFDEIPADGRRNALREVMARAARFENATDPASAMIWKPIGPLPVATNWPWGAATGRVKSIAISPADPSLILVGSSGGGIWRSTDAGRNFVPVSDTHADLAVGAIAFAPSNPRIVYAAMGSEFLGTGVLRSDDAGITWRLVSGSTYGTLGQAPRMIVDPADPNRLWVAQYSRLDTTSGSTRSGGVLFSEDGGATWKNQLGGLPSDLVAVPGSAATFLAGMYRVDGSGSGAGVYRTTNGGATWTSLLGVGGNGTGLARVAVSPAAPERIYAYLHSAGPPESRRIMVSNDSGATWAQAPAFNLSADTPVFIAADPHDADVLYVGMRDLYKSSDRGLTFANVTRGYNNAGRFDPRNSTSHVDQHAIAFHPFEKNALYIGNDGGVFRSKDGSVSFESLSGTLSLVQAYGIAAHPTDPSTVFLGTQDNGLERRDASGAWRELITGDYGSILFDPANPDTIVTNYVYGLIMAFTERGSVYRETVATNATFEENERPRIAFIAPFEQSRANNALYFGTYRLFISRDFGKTWTAPAGVFDLTRGATDRLGAIGPSADGKTVYTGSQRGRVMISTDEGAKWRDISGGLPNRAVRAIAVDPSNPNVAYVGFSGYVTDHVFRTRDGGSTWENLNNGLPDVPVNALLLHGGYVYAGTDIGVFRYDGGTWTYYSSGMPPVMVTDFDVTATGTIIAATHGRGAYQLVPHAPSGKRRSARH